MSTMRLKPIMFVGTGSDVGKSVINAAFCRIFLQDGYHPAPFKAQNMSLNSYATKDQLEIGRAQAVQAEACGIECQVEMNPILLKPTNDKTAQVIVNGKPIGNKTAIDYFEKTDRNELFFQATQAFERLNHAFNPIVIEGAGSISEVNLWDKDIVNMRMALYTKADTYLIADIDKGGIFGSVYGSLLLLPPDERQAIKGIIINKFRGDIELFKEGRSKLEELTGKPVVGVIPYFHDIFIEQEDQLVIHQPSFKTAGKKIIIAVVLLKHMANFTDFNILEQLSDVHLFYTHDPTEIALADIVILPGSKNTLADLLFLRSIGMTQAIMEHHKANKSLYGICGGFQMMGQWIYDPLHIESEVEALPGLGIFPLNTTLAVEKQTRQCTFSLIHTEAKGVGYEIHAGVTPTDKPFSILENGEKEGYFLNSKTWGTYMHGVFDNPSVIQMILREVDSTAKVEIDYKTQKEDNYNRLADWVRENIDMDSIYNLMKS